MTILYGIMYIVHVLCFERAAHIAILAQLPHLPSPVLALLPRVVVMATVSHFCPTPHLKSLPIAGSQPFLSDPTP